MIATFDFPDESYEEVDFIPLGFFNYKQFINADALYIERKAEDQ